MFLGFLIGVLLGGFLSDKFGRRLLVYIPCSMCNVLALLASFVHVYWLYVLLRVLVGVFVGKKDLFKIGSGKGGPDPAFPHSRIPAFSLRSFFTRIPFPELPTRFTLRAKCRVRLAWLIKRLLCRLLLFFPRALHHVPTFWLPTSRVVVKFRIPFNVSRITHRILVISRIQGIASRPGSCTLLYVPLL